MPKNSETKFNVIFSSVQRALLFYNRFRAKAFVPQSLVGYLLVIEETNSIEIWRDNILPAYLHNYRVGNHKWNLDPKRMAALEKLAVDYYLNGFKIAQIAKTPAFVDAELGAQIVNEWIFGSKRRDGLINTMTKLVLKEGSYCPFCQHIGRNSSQAYIPKVTGRSCDCLTRILERREADND